MGLTDKTVIIRTADHGEMGMSHGTLIQKNFNMWVAGLTAPVLRGLLCCVCSVLHVLPALSCGQQCGDD